MTNQDFQYFNRVQDLLKDNQSFVSVTLVAGRGHVPQNIGAKMLVNQKGLFFGTVGGGEAEAQAIELAKDLLKGNRSQLLQDLNLQTEAQMTCGGEISLYFEAFRPHSWHIAVFGSGHVAQAVIPLLLTLDCQVTCIDTRAEWLEKLPSSPKLTKILSEDMSLEVEKLAPQTYMMLMTQGHATDLPILKKIYQSRKAPYVGMIGSAVKAQSAKKELLDAGISNETIQDLHCPMGLKLGSNSPSEIAISMAAELLHVRDQIS